MSSDLPAVSVDETLTDLNLYGPHTYTWGTDAASGEFKAADLGAAIVRLVAEKEWFALDTVREQHSIDSGAWLYVREDGVEILRRGEMG